MMNIGGGEVVGSTMSLPSRKTNEVVNANGCLVSQVTDEFPVGLRVLVVDDDPTCLTVLEKMLRTCRYEVTKTSRAEVALSLLRENRNGFDVVISDVHMPDMDGFKLLECVGLEMDLPVIMMSADDSKHVVMKGVRHGACDYLIKPVRIEALKNIWQHVVRKKRTDWNVEQSGSWDEGDRLLHKQDDALSSPATDGGWKSSKRKGDEEESDEKDDTATLKKPRVVWSVELHQQFVAAVNQLGIDKAVPKKILELMNVPGLTRENVASHLQKYRLYLRRLSGVSHHQGGSFMPQDSGFSSMSSLGGIDLQTLAATGQLSAQALAAYTRMTPGIKPGMSVPFVDQRNLFSFENSKLRYGEGQQQLGNINNQMNLFHVIPTNMEPKPLVGLNQSEKTLGNLNMQANPSSSHQSGPLLTQRGQTLIGQTMQSNVSTDVLSRNGIPYNSVSRATSVVDFSGSHISDLAGSGFPLGSTPGITSKGFNQEESSSNVKATRGYNPSYDVIGELQQHKSPDWQLINPGMTFGGAPRLTTPMQSSMNVAPSVVVNQPYEQNENPNANANALGSEQIFLAGLDNQNLGTQTSHQSFNGLGDNSWRVKAETIAEVVSPGTNVFSEHYGRDDLMSALLKQQRECVVPGEFNSDGCTLDSFHV